MSDEVRFEVDLKPVEDMKNLILALTGDMRPVLTDANYLRMRSIRRNFDAEGRPANWAPLKPATVKRRGSAHPILQVQGILMRSVTVRKAKYNIFRVTTNAAEFGTRDPKAATHEFGDGDRNIPARPFMTLPDSDTPEMVRLFQQYLFRAISKGVLT